MCLHGFSWASMIVVRMGRTRAGPGSFGLDGGSWTEDVSKPPLQSARTHNRPSDAQGVSIKFWHVSQGRLLDIQSLLQYFGRCTSSGTIQCQRFYKGLI